ncbi:SU10 major capsid protein [Actinomadura luteofluorescens]|uniref:SU10 major capsid protein n=1 Tax=Actinomadura luteofluorescens TaxID=46163 RepID=UPI003D89B144
MAGITGMGLTYNLPNYVGELIALTPDDTPLLSAIGGLTGGKSTTATEFEWQTYDLRDATQGRVRVEGAAAPTAEERVRANVRNICQIHQEKVSVSYTKQAAVGQNATPSSAPYVGVPGTNPVGNEMSWQVMQALKQVKLDVNFSFINGTYNRPTDNTTARRTRGLLQAITTNRIAKGTSFTGASSATDTITSTAHGLTDGTKIVFTNTDAATNIYAGRVYYVVSSATNTFKVATTSGGSALTLGTASNIAFTKPWSTTLTTDHVNDLLQLAFDNGGISEQETATLLCNSIQKRAVTKAYMTAFSGYNEQSRNVGGVNVTTITTDFGTLNVMMDRHMPQDTLAVVSLEDLAPVFLDVPGKGHFFEEPLAKVGASDETQLYGEIGLEYGAEKHHGVTTGLVV